MMNKSLLSGKFGGTFDVADAWFLCTEYHCVIDQGCCLANDPFYKSARFLEQWV